MLSEPIWVKPSNRSCGRWEEEPTGDCYTAAQIIMMMSSNGNILRVTCPLCGEFTGYQWIPLTKASDATRLHRSSWWRHQMETFSASLALCAGNSPVTGEFPSQRPVMLHSCTDHHDDVIKWKHSPRYWPFVRGIHRSPVNSPHKGQWRGALMFALIYAWTNSWVNNQNAGDLRCYHAHYDVIVMITKHLPIL